MLRRRPPRHVTVELGTTIPRQSVEHHRELVRVGLEVVTKLGTQHTARIGEQLKEMESLWCARE